MNYVEFVKDWLGKKIDVESDLLDLYTLLVFVKGQKCTLEDVHNAWSIWRTNTNREHKSIIPFPALSEKIQEMDREYCEAIRQTAKEQI